jgi:hypothetical protein
VTGSPAHPVEEPFSYEGTFAREQLSDGSWRIRAGVASGTARVLRSLGLTMEPPYRVLYLLHTSRIGAPLGRYASGELSTNELDELIERYGSFFECDARHDLWLHSPRSQGTVVLDRYDMLYAYGDLQAMSAALSKLGVTEVAPFAGPRVPRPHALHYRPEWDEAEQGVLGALPWQRTALSPEDVQHWFGPQAS